ncbi:MAG TPA: hypothetical protein VGG84_09080 [Gemmatimonadaceae bacterium]
MGRHAYLSEHLCRLFGEAGAECQPAVGGAEALRIAARFEPHVIVCDSDLVTPALLVPWALDPALADVPVLAVTLTHRPDDQAATASNELAAAVYLPALQRAQVSSLLSCLPRPRRVAPPLGWSVSPADSSAQTR